LVQFWSLFDQYWYLQSYAEMHNKANNSCRCQDHSVAFPTPAQMTSQEIIPFLWAIRLENTVLATGFEALGQPPIQLSTIWFSFGLFRDGLTEL